MRGGVVERGWQHGTVSDDEAPEFVWDRHRPLSDAERHRLDERRRKAGGVLGAAMLAMGSIIEPAKTHAAAVEVDAEADNDDDPLGEVGFGRLPPLG